MSLFWAETRGMLLEGEPGRIWGNAPVARPAAVLQHPRSLLSTAFEICPSINSQGSPGCLEPEKTALPDLKSHPSLLPPPSASPPLT